LEYRANHRNRKNKKKHENVHKLRDTLLVEYPEATDVLYTDSYLSSVLSAPDRSFERSVDKLKKCLSWRREFKVNEIQPDLIQKEMNNQSLYWFGYDIYNHPIIWVRPKFKNYKKLDVQKELKMHVLFIETAIAKMMPRDTNTFTLIADTNGLGMTDFDIGLMQGLINLVTSTYPDRMEAFYAGPINFVVRMMYKLLSPALPSRLVAKIHLMNNPKQNLLDRLLEEDIPEFFKGPCHHPTFKDGSNNFSFETMLRIMEEKKPKIVIS